MPAILEKTIGNSAAKELCRILRPFEESAAYVATHHEELLEKYPEQWVAVSGTEVLAVSATRLGLIRKIRNLTVDAGNLDVTFLTRKPQTLIL